MRLASFTASGGATYGLVVDGGVVDLGARLGQKYPDLPALLATGEHEAEKLAGLTADYPLDQIRWQLPVTRPEKILCVGINYQAHIAETGREPPRYPWLFTRFADSLVGHEEALVKPDISDFFDYEGELAVVIGQPAYRITAAQAMDHVAGFTCFMDGSVRNFQRHSPLFTAGKNFLASGAMGPWIVTRRAAPPPAEMVLETRLNGNVMQHSSVGDLCFDIPALIEYCAKFTRLNPGDVIATGTPGGVGFARDPKVWLQPGDRVEVAVSGVAELANTVVDEAGAAAVAGLSSDGAHLL